MTMHSIDVQIIYVQPEQVWSKKLIMPRGATPIDLIKKSGFLEAFAELTLEELHYGVYSQRVDQHYLMNNFDRLEIYRPLNVDPKTVRRELAKTGKTMSGKDV